MPSLPHLDVPRMNDGCLDRIGGTHPSMRETPDFRIGPHEVLVRRMAGRWTAAVDRCVTVARALPGASANSPLRRVSAALALVAAAGGACGHPRRRAEGFRGAF